MSVAEAISNPLDLYEAEFLVQDPSWMIGKIRGDHEVVDKEVRAEVVRAVIRAVQPVPEENKNVSTCTDGRYRMGTLGNNRIGVAEQLVGSSILTGFVAAEALGPQFYTGIDYRDPVDRRLNYFADFLKDNDEEIIAHLVCGGVEGFLPVTINSLGFVMNLDFKLRARALMPEGVYDERVVLRQRAQTLQRIDDGAYHGYGAGIVLGAAKRYGGESAIETFLDDHRGVHGHIEDLIVRFDRRLGGVALAPNMLAEDPLDIQAFGLNDSRIEKLALMMSNGGDRQGRYVEAWNAMEVFTDSAHGTLADRLPTLVIRPKHNI